MTDLDTSPAPAAPADPVVRLQPSGKHVPCHAGDTILGALERAGFVLPNNCRAGACGECRTKVLSGSFDQGMVLDMALSQEDRLAGYGLMCMAKPTSDVVEIDFGAADALPKLFAPRTDVTFVVVDRIVRTPTIVELRLRPVGDNLRFWPGQYVMLGDDRNGAPPRPYSIANAPRPDGEIHLLVARVHGGATSTWIHERVAAGDTVQLAGPYGTFVGDPSVEGPVLCLAAGSGLAPILSLTDAALRRGFPHPVTILFSARTPDDVVDPGMMSWWAARHRRFRFLVTLTGTAEGTGHGVGSAVAGALRGRIPELLPSLFPDLTSTSVFVAGSPEFVDACASTATQCGARPEVVHVEGYHLQARAETPPAERLVR